jgi:hypothetical protein
LPKLAAANSAAPKGAPATRVRPRWLLASYRCGQCPHRSSGDCR